MAKKRVLMVGAGGWARTWVRNFLPALSHRIEVVGLVDFDADVLTDSADLLGVPPSRRFSDLEVALASVKADFGILAIPPKSRRQAVALAAQHALPLLCEKPLADSWENSLAILHLVEEVNLKLAVVQNYRAERRMLTLNQVLDTGKLGRINSIHCRFATDFNHKTGPTFRHQIPNAMIYESAEHHFDQLRNLSGADCEWVSGTHWNAPWSNFDYSSCAMFVMQMTNGVMCQYEMSYIARSHQNGWHHEFYRVECEHGSVVLDADDVVRVIEHLGDGNERVTEVHPVEIEQEGHLRVIVEFLDWLDGGSPPSTEIHDNIRTAALAFAAIEASHNQTVVNVREMLADSGFS